MVKVMVHAQVGKEFPDMRQNESLLQQETLLEQQASSRENRP